MKNVIKTIFGAFALLILYTSCEVDDICLEATTPRLLIKFYDATDTKKVKKTTDLYVAAIKKDTIYEKVAVDSIFVPLDTGNKSTTYKMSVKLTDVATDTLTFTYVLKNVFVSKSCGYKTIFTDFSTTTTKHWIKDIKVQNTVIENEKNTHIHIYY